MRLAISVIAFISSGSCFYRALAELFSFSEGLQAKLDDGYELDF